MERADIGEKAATDRWERIDPIWWTLSQSLVRRSLQSYVDLWTLAEPKVVSAYTALVRAAPRPTLRRAG